MCYMLCMPFRIELLNTYNLTPNIKNMVLVSWLPDKHQPVQNKFVFARQCFKMNADAVS